MNNQFVLITGASEGLGKSFSIECARRRMDVLLVALPDSGLAELAGFLVENFNIRAFYFETDLSIEENCISLCQYVKVNKYPVNILINNAGIGSLGPFNEQSYLFYIKQIQVNIMATTIITHQLINTLEKNTPSYILNTGSLINFFHMPYKVVYGATKTYIYYFSKSLRQELKKLHIYVSVLCPAGINTTPFQFRTRSQCGFFTRLSYLEPKEVAHYAINKLFQRKDLIIPGKVVKVFFQVHKILPEYLKNKMSTRAIIKMEKEGQSLKNLRPVSL